MKIFHHQSGRRHHKPPRWVVSKATLVLFILLLSSWPAAATQPQVTPKATAGNYGLYGAFLGFGAGIVSAYGLHEGAHWAAAGVTGTDLHWESGTYNQPLGFTEKADCDTDGAILHGAGLTGQALSGEVILAMDRIDKTTPYIRGFMFWNIANPLIYAFDYWFLHYANRIDTEGYQGDLAGIEHYAGKDAANAFAGASAALALWQGYRFLNSQHTVTPASPGGPKFGVAPAPQGGALFTLQIAF